MHYLRCLSLNLNTWFISVKDELSDVNFPTMSAIRFNMDHCTFDVP